MPRIVLFAATTGYQTRRFAEAARRLSVSVTLATDRCHVLEDPWRDNAIPIRFDEPEASADSLALAMNAEVDGIVAVADRPTVIAALTAERLGIPWHSSRAAEACRDKNRMRALFAQAGLPAPEFRRISLVPGSGETDHADFPCVLKPLGLSASRGVIRANNRAEFEAALARIRGIVEHAEGEIQVEQYIPGREFALEGLMTHGELKTLAIFDKPDPLEGPFFEETIYVTPSREPAAIQRAMVSTTQRACAALGLWHGPIHAEMRVNEAGVYMLEIAARPIGGLCARALRFGEIGLEELIILHAIGRTPGEIVPESPASGVMMIPVPRAGIYQSVEGIGPAREIPGIDDITITAKRGERLTPLPEGASYTGFIFATGKDPAFVEHALRRAHEALRFEILAALDIVS